MVVVDPVSTSTVGDSFVPLKDTESRGKMVCLVCQDKMMLYRERDPGTEDDACFVFSYNSLLFFSSLPRDRDKPRWHATDN